MGKIVIAATALIGVTFGTWLARARAAWARANAKHDPIEYYRGWTGYSHPVYLGLKISKEEDDALHAEGRVYLIGYYNEGKLTRVIKMLKGTVFFDFEYTYYPRFW